MTLATTQHLLHPREVQELKGRKHQREAMLAGAGYGNSSPGLARVVTGALQNPQAIVKEIREIDGILQREGPQPIPSNEMDDAIKLERSLREDWLEGMPAQDEYRRNTSGAVDKHRKWERDKKDSVLKWKHLRRRLHASGVSDHGLSDEEDVSNVEKYRPRKSNADPGDAQIPQTRVFHQMPPGASPVRVMTDQQAAVMEEVAPDLKGRMATLSNEDRSMILDKIDALINARHAVHHSAQTRRQPSEWDAIRQKAKGLGIKSFGKTRDQVEAEIAAKEG